MADCSLSDWDDIPDDSKSIYEAMARLELAELPICRFLTKLPSEAEARGLLRILPAEKAA